MKVFFYILVLFMAGLISACGLVTSTSSSLGTDAGNPGSFGIAFVGTEEEGLTLATGTTITAAQFEMDFAELKPLSDCGMAEAPKIEDLDIPEEYRDIIEDAIDEADLGELGDSIHVPSEGSVFDVDYEKLYGALTGNTSDGNNEDASVEDENLKGNGQAKGNNSNNPNDPDAFNYKNPNNHITIDLLDSENNVIELNSDSFEEGLYCSIDLKINHYKEPTGTATPGENANGNGNDNGQTSISLGSSSPNGHSYGISKGQLFAMEGTREDGTLFYAVLNLGNRFQFIGSQGIYVSRGSLYFATLSFLDLFNQVDLATAELTNGVILIDRLHNPELAAQLLRNLMAAAYLTVDLNGNQDLDDEERREENKIADGGFSEEWEDALDEWVAADGSNPEGEDAPVVDEEDEPAPDEEDEPAPDEEDEPAPDEEDDPVVDEEDDPVVDEEDDPVVDEEDDPVVDEEDDPSIDEETDPGNSGNAPGRNKDNNGNGNSK